MIRSIPEDAELVELVGAEAASSVVLALHACPDMPRHYGCINTNLVNTQKVSMGESQTILTSKILYRPVRPLLQTGWNRDVTKT